MFIHGSHYKKLKDLGLNTIVMLWCRPWRVVSRTTTSEGIKVNKLRCLNTLDVIYLPQDTEVNIADYLEDINPLF